MTEIIEFELHKIADNDLLEAGQHQPGVPFKGPSGRWFVINKSGRTVPAKNPDAKQDAPKGPASKPTAPKSTSKPTQPKKEDHDDPDEFATPKEREEEAPGEVEVPKEKSGIVRSVASFLGKHVSKGAGTAFAKGGLMALATYEVGKAGAQAARAAAAVTYKVAKGFINAENGLPAKALDKLGAAIHRAAEATGTNWGGWSDHLPVAGEAIMHTIGLNVAKMMMNYNQNQHITQGWNKALGPGGSTVVNTALTGLMYGVTYIRNKMKPDETTQDQKRAKVDPAELAGLRGDYKRTQDEEDLFAIPKERVTPRLQAQRDESNTRRKMEKDVRRHMRKSAKQDAKVAKRNDDVAAKFLLGEAKEQPDVFPLIVDMFHATLESAGKKVPRATIEKLLKELR